MPPNASQDESPPLKKTERIQKSERVEKDVQRNGNKKGSSAENDVILEMEDYDAAARDRRANSKRNGQHTCHGCGTSILKRFYADQRYKQCPNDACGYMWCFPCIFTRIGDDKFVIDGRCPRCREPPACCCLPNGRKPKQPRCSPDVDSHLHCKNCPRRPFRRKVEVSSSVPSAQLELLVRQDSRINQIAPGLSAPSNSAESLNSSFPFDRQQRHGHWELAEVMPQMTPYSTMGRMENVAGGDSHLPPMSDMDPLDPTKLSMSALYQAYLDLAQQHMTLQQRLHDIEGEGWARYSSGGLMAMRGHPTGVSGQPDPQSAPAMSDRSLQGSSFPPNVLLSRLPSNPEFVHGLSERRGRSGDNPDLGVAPLGFGAVDQHTRHGNHHQLSSFSGVVDRERPSHNLTLDGEVWRAQFPGRMTTAGVPNGLVAGLHESRNRELDPPAYKYSSIDSARSSDASRTRSDPSDSARRPRLYDGSERHRVILSRTASDPSDRGKRQRDVAQNGSEMQDSHRSLVYSALGFDSDVRDQPPKRRR